STTAAAAAPEQSAALRVNEVVRAPQAIGRIAGQRITVELQSLEEIHPGARFTFFARPKLFADSLVVIELGRQPAEPGVGAGEAEMQDAFVRLGTAALERRLERAEAVVVGRVSNVRPSIVAAAVPEMLPTMSEHDPDWHE